MIIREATEADATVIAEIYNESIQAGGATMDLEQKTRSDILKYMKGFNDRECYLLLDRGDGYVIGWGVIKSFGEGPAYHHCCETSVYLRHAEVRKGYGSRIKEAVIDRCRVYEYHHLVARVWASNTASVEYNRRYGYEVVGIQREIGFVEGRWVDIALMQLVLD